MGEEPARVSAGRIRARGPYHAVDDADAHCAAARAAGAEIMQEPQDQFYGDRTYRARDLEGHHWTFGQHLRDVTAEEMEAVTQLKVDYL